MNRKIFLISVFTTIIDQISKLVVENILKLNESITIIKKFFSITFIENSGAAFGILKNSRVFLIIISFVALILIYSNTFNFKLNMRNNIAFGLITGGILGNLIDRLFLGHVRDFLSFRFGNYFFPVFNIADIAITFGIILLIVSIFKGDDVRNEN